MPLAWRHVMCSRHGVSNDSEPEYGPYRGVCWARKRIGRTGWLRGALLMVRSFVQAAVISIAGFGLAVFAVAQQTAPAAQAPRPAIVFHPVPAGEKAPDFTAFTPADQPVTLSSLKGKVVILDFWATWCGPCQVSMPGLEEVYRRIKSKGVVVFSLNTWDEKPAFKDWVQQHSGQKYHFDFVRDPAEGDHDGIRKASIAKRLYGVAGIPTMYVIDRDGNVAGSLMGSGNEEGLIKLLAKVGVDASKPKS
jgi:thiol-disulfide isomerase/thioredoxin